MSENCEKISLFYSDNEINIIIDIIKTLLSLNNLLPLLFLFLLLSFTFQLVFHSSKIITRFLLFLLTR